VKTVQHRYGKTISNGTMNGLTQEMIFRILMLHELGQSQKTIQMDLFKAFHIKISFKLINGITEKADRLVEEWLDSLRRIFDNHPQSFLMENEKNICP
jgi:hypothetical protein